MPRIRYTAAEYTDMVLTYGECHQNAALALRTYRERYGNTRTCPTNSRVFILAVQRLRENRRLVPQGEGVSSNSSIEDRILQHFENNPTCSLRNAARRFQVSHRTVHRILKRHARRPYKFRKVQQLLSRDMPVRMLFCRWLLDKISDDPDFIFNIMWTDESTFTRNGVWNRQNLRYWSNENPHLTRESSFQYRFSLNVWAGIHRNKIIGPVFIDGTLNAQKFLELLSGPVSDYTDDLPLDVYGRLWYQLDGAPAHSVVPVRQRLTDMFQSQWIGRFGPIRWPARSPDLTPLDFFLWGA